MDNGLWAIDVISGAFANGSYSVQPSAVNYDPGAATATSGNATFTAGSGGAMDASQQAFGASSIIGVNDAQWNPTITVTLPSDAVAGSYSGTITHSVA